MTDLPFAVSPPDSGASSRPGAAAVDLKINIERANEGNDEAFAAIVGSLHRSVFRWALSFARDADDADEITQETFVLVHRNLDRYRGESSLEGWVYGIVRSIGLQKRRRAKRREFLSSGRVPGIDSAYHTDPGARVDREQIANYIRHFFLELPPRQREVFDLVDLQGHDPAEVALLLNTKPATVRGNLFKARASIRAHIMATHPAWGEVDR